MIQKAGILLLLAVLLLYWYRIERPKEERRKRERQMMNDYPEILAGLTVLTGAGLSLPQAWMRLLSEYEGKKEKKGVRWAYEEMAVTGRQIQNGVSPGRAFGEFGRRIGLHAYIKLGTILEQNMKKGSMELCGLLQAESLQAFEERKQGVRREGEIISTKLMIPMFMMFGVVLIIIIIPALQSLAI